MVVDVLNHQLGYRCDAAVTVGIGSMITQLGVVLTVSIGGDEEGEVRHEQKLHFKRVHFSAWNTSDLGVVGVVIVLIIEKLGGQHHTRDQQPVNIQAIDNEGGIRLNDAIDVHESQHETLTAARCILGNTNEVVFDGDGRRAQCMKFAHSLVGVGCRQTVVSDTELVQHTS